MNFGITSNGKNKLLKKNIGRTKTNDVNNAVFSDPEIEPTNSPSNIKFTAANNKIRIISALKFKDIPNNKIMPLITIISIIDNIAKYITFEIINEIIDVGLSNVLAIVPI